MIKRILFLDDDPDRFLLLKKFNTECDILWVQRVSTFIVMARKMDFDLIMMDHDLGYEESYHTVLSPINHGQWFPGTLPFDGRDAATLLAEDPGSSLGTEIHIHSHNEPAAERMMEILSKSGHWDNIRLTPF